MKKSNHHSLIIHGCGGHARSVADVAINNGINEIIFIDDAAKPNEMLFGFPVHSNTSLLNTEDYEHFVAVGDNTLRANMFNLLKKENQKIISIISTHSYISKMAHINPGVFVGHQAYVGPNVKIGENTIINTRSLIEHDCIIGSHCHVSINTTLAGKCQIGDYVTIGAGATIIDKINVCSNVIIGAGAAVVNHISEPGTYVGVPARKATSKKAVTVP